MKESIEAPENIRRDARQGFIQFIQSEIDRLVALRAKLGGHHPRIPERIRLWRVALEAH